MLTMEDQPYNDVVEDGLRRIGYNAGFYSTHQPVRECGSIRPLTRRERKMVESVSKERGYRRFAAFRMGV